MTSPQPPRLASALLDRLTPSDTALRGDLDETYRHGRSASWYWRQAVGLIVLSPIRHVRNEPLRVIRGLVVGWGVLAIVFGLLGDTLAYGGAALLYPGWTHDGAYQTHVWWPFYLSSVVQSYVGFGLSAWMVVRFHRAHPGAVLMLYITSILLLMATLVVIVALRAPAPTPLPHALFPIVSVALPYQARSGFLLVPLTMLLVGLLGVRPSSRAATT